ncbi:MAG: substrate-binding and VWA domain-containing protein [Anaerolineales bacterium]|nr:substrate-binding and VWA domain-containing protein [Anaerolineales bacterium]MDW8277847.1 substrate-binding and VWA domain-containing protein [Anaerolineales bacterium]
MKRSVYILLSLLAILSLTLSACGQIQGLIPGGSVTVSIVYGSEKKEWLEPLVAQFNEARNKTADGKVIVVESTPMGSIESVRGILEGRLQPTVWSPASSVYIPVANAEWRKLHGSDLVTGNPNDLVLSPVVIAMWKPMAQALGWPEKAIGWADIAELATSEQGWSAYGHPEWGDFKFGHTHPAYSNSGIVSIIAEAYAATGKQRGLTEADLNDPKVREFMAAVEKSIIHYGTSTGFFAERMFERGPSYLSAAVLYENLIVAQETKRLSGQSSQIPVVAIYPKEGTFWTNNPYVVVNAPWVTEEQREAAGIFEAFLLDRPQQLKALEYGFRPADPSIPLTAPLDAEHGIDITQPKTILEIPNAAVIDKIQALWRETKKPVDLVVVMDISGSMRGDKITTARASLLEFVKKLDDRDRLQIILFSSNITTLTPLTPLGPKRQQVLDSVSGIFETGDTRLYDATLAAYQDLAANGDPNHIRAIVVLSDGADTASTQTLEEVMAQINASAGEGGNAIKIFTIAFGSDADESVLKQIAEPTGGKQYKSSPENIQKIYDEIATFF